MRRLPGNNVPRKLGALSVTKDTVVEMNYSFLQTPVVLSVLIFLQIKGTLWSIDRCRVTVFFCLDVVCNRTHTRGLKKLSSMQHEVDTKKTSRCKVWL